MPRFTFTIFASLRSRLVGLILIAVIPMFGLTLYTGMEEHRLAAVNVQTTALQMARLIIDDNERFVEGTHQLLVGLSQLSEVRNLDSTACSAIFANLLNHYPQYNDIGATNANGNLFCAAKTFTPPISSADRPWFKRVLETRDFAVGEYQIGKVTGKTGLAFSYPVFDDTGQIRAVVFAILDLKLFSDLAAKAKLSEGTVLTVRDRNGTILARYPDPEKWVGKSVPEAPILKEILTAKGEGTTEVAGVDGVNRLYVFAPLFSGSEAGVHLSLGIPSNVAYADVERIFRRNIIALGTVTLLMLAAVWLGGHWFFMRQVQALLAATKRMSGGDLSARTGLAHGRGELPQLAWAFDEMAESIDLLTGQLRKTEARYRTLVETAPCAITIHDSEKFTYANPAAEHITGYTKEELLTKYFWEIIHPDFQESIKEREQARQRGEPILLRDEIEIVRKSGEERWVDFTEQLIEFEGQESVLTAAFDITESKQAEEVAGNLGRQNKLILDAVDQGIFGMDLEGRITFFNNAAMQMSGWRADQLIGETAHPLLHHSKADGAPYPEEECPNYRAIESGLSQHRDNEVLWRKDGTNFPVEYASTPMRDEHDKLVGTVVVFKDISERKQAKEEHLRLATAIEQANESVVITNAKGIIQYVNPAFERISGYSRNEVIGKHPRFLKSDLHDPAFYRTLRDTVSRGEVWKGRITYRNKNGSPFDLETSISPVRNSSGAIIDHVAVQRDVTHEARLERQLRQAQKMEAIGTLAGGIAHDFNNILAAVLGYTELAMDEATTAGPMRRHLEQVFKAGERAKSLVKQILTFSRQTEQERKPVGVSHIVKEALKLLRASLPSTIEIEQNIAVVPQGDLVLADPTQIHQVLMNLCTNAAHAMREKGGILHVELANAQLDPDTSLTALHQGIHEGPYLRLTVNDTGHGMDREIMERIFDPFFTTKSAGEGTGMGLAVVHGIVKSHGGLITVNSKPGEGTTFDVYLPKIETDETEKTDHLADAALIGGDELILFVDDEEALADMAQERLNRLGYTVSIMTDSMAALELFRAHPDAFDLVMTDQTMPHLTGVQLATELLKIRPDIPIILCTGFSEIITAEKAKALGIREFLLKPLITRDVARAIRQVLDGGAVSR